MNSDKMSASRDMDVLVAERVMGWIDAPNIYSHDGKVREFRTPPGRDSDFIRHAAMWSPSNDIAAAWEVVEQICASDRVWVEIAMLGPFVDGTPRHWQCIFLWRKLGETDAHPFHRASAEAESASLAICRAALKAVKED